MASNLSAAAAMQLLRVLARDSGSETGSSVDEIVTRLSWRSDLAHSALAQLGTDTSDASDDQSSSSGPYLGADRRRGDRRTGDRRRSEVSVDGVSVDAINVDQANEDTVSVIGLDEGAPADES
jgi:hypothetical protein